MGLKLIANGRSIICNDIGMEGGREGGERVDILCTYKEEPLLISTKNTANTVWESTH